MDNPQTDRLLDDRLIDVAIKGRDNLEAALADLLSGRRANDAPEVTRWLRTILDEAGEALAQGDSRGSVSDLASAAETMLQGDIFELAAILCGLAANNRSELEENGHPVAPSDVANLHNVTGLLAFRLGRLPTAQDLFANARELASQAGDPGMGAAAALNLCNVARLQGDQAAARRLADEAEQLYIDAGDNRGQLQLGLTQANMAIEDGNFQAAGEHLAAIVDITKMRHPDLTASYHHARGRVLAHERRWDDAEEAMQRSLRAARRAHHADHELATMQSLAALASERGQSDLARRRTKAAVTGARAKRLNHRVELLLPSYISGELRAGNRGEATEAAQELLELATASGQGVADAQFLLGSAALESGYAASALEYLERAREVLAAAPGSERRLNLASDIFHNTVLAYDALGTAGEHAESLARWARDLPDGARALEHLGFALSRGRRWEEATRFLLEAFAARPANERAWAGLVAAHQLHGRASPGARTALLRSAVGVAEEQQQHTLAIRVRNDLALARVDDGDLDEALMLLEVNLRTADELADSVMRQQALYNIAETRRRLQDLEAADRDARASLQLAESLEDFDNVASSLVQIAQILGERDLHEESMPLLQRAAELSAPGTTAHAAAISGLAGLALADDPATAAALYTQSLELRDHGTVNHLENLIFLSEALAATGQRRAFVSRLRQIVDESLDTPLNLNMALGMARIAAAWSAAGKPQYAGEVLALMFLIWLRQVDEERALDDDDSPFYTGLSAAAYELHREEEVGDPADKTRVAVAKELRSQDLSEETVARMMELLDVAEKPFKRDDQDANQDDPGDNQED